MRPDIADYLVRRPREVRGWLAEVDFRMFDWLLSRQGHGDLLEIGAYEGASAILIGMHVREGETFTVCDLFAVPDESEGNFAESHRWYTDLTRETFERNYLRFLPALPRIVQDDSRRVLEYIEPGTCRFVHVDGAHPYEFVAADLASARTLLNDDGLVVCDDWRGFHTPGVTVATMEAIVNGGLHVVVTTPGKLYGTWSAAAASELRDAIARWAESAPELILNSDVVHGVAWPRVDTPRQPQTAGRGPRLRDLLARTRNRA